MNRFTTLLLKGTYFWILGSANPGRS